MASNPWIRLYRESLHDPKIVTLSDRQHRAWHNCLLIADDTGKLPAIRDIASHMRMTITDAEQMLLDLVEAELIDAGVFNSVRTYRMHGWDKRQYVSDVSTDRVRKHRERKAETPRNGDETFQKRPQTSDSEPESETDKNKFLPSEQVAAREEVKELGFKFDPMGEARRGVSPRLKGIAEGMGLDVESLVAKAEAPNIEKPNGYFSTLCQGELRRLLPHAPDLLLKAAMTVAGEGARKTVFQMLVEVTNV